MDAPTPTNNEAITPDALKRANVITFVGLGLTFVLALLIILADYDKPGSVSPELLWPFVAALGVHSVGSNKYLCP